jgi:DNA-binding beta-propeller fold protein YncE
MPLAVSQPAVRVPVFSGFDYVTVDAAHGRVYAAHTASERLLIVDAATGKVQAQIKVGPMHGVAVDSQTGDVFTGNGTDRTVSKVDPVAQKVVASVDVPGDVDAIAFDPELKRIYADQDGGGHVYVIDAKTMKLIATLTMPSDDLESPAVDEQTHMFYQNLADSSSFAIVDPNTLKVVRVVKTPQLVDNHPLAFSGTAKTVAVGGKNGLMSTYTPNGDHVGDGHVQPDIDQCSIGETGAIMACAGKGVISVVALPSGAAPKLLASIDTGHPVHTVGVDEQTGDLWVVWSDERGDFVQRLHWKP